jgi:hypothetical protein
LDRIIQIVLRVVIARTVGLVVNHGVGWLQRRGRTAAIGDAERPPRASAEVPGPRTEGDGGGKPGPWAPPGPTAPAGTDAKRLRQQMRLLRRINRMR